MEMLLLSLSFLGETSSGIHPLFSSGEAKKDNPSTLVRWSLGICEEERLPKKGFGDHRLPLSSKACITISWIVNSSNILLSPPSPESRIFKIPKPSFPFPYVPPKDLLPNFLGKEGGGGPSFAEAAKSAKMSVNFRGGKKGREKERMPSRATA